MLLMNTTTWGIQLLGEYNYLGNTITPTLNFIKNFQSPYKKVSGRINLLSKVREYLIRQAAEKVYQTMICTTDVILLPSQLLETIPNSEKVTCKY